MNNKMNTTKGENDMNEAPPLETNKLYYNCTECSLVIGIISVDEDNIEFKCSNNHNIKMKIKEYLDSMKNYNDKDINNNICNIHKEDYLSYCYECNIHLCNEFM